MARRRTGLAAALLAGVVTTLTAACTGTPDAPDPDPDWQVVTLPAPPGPPGRIAVRDAVRCDGRWYAVGGVFLAEPTADQDSRPAAWTSPDGTTWTSLAVAADTFWGQRAILGSIACSDGRVAVVGARSGGAHGNPRVTTFFEEAGTLHDVVAAFSQYGGDQATNVGPVAGGRVGGGPGWLITGNRTSGPAVWTSTDPRVFTLHEGVPGLADDDRHRALAQAAVWSGHEWVVVGGVNAPGSLDRQPAAWTSPDGAGWSRAPVPGTDGFDELDRAVRTGDGILALGLSGDRFRSWRYDADGWHRGRAFGRIPQDAPGGPFAASLTRGAGLWATTSDGAGYRLWHSSDGDRWREVPTPNPAPSTAGDHLLAVVAAADGVLLLSDDGVDGRLWWAAASH